MDLVRTVTVAGVTTLTLDSPANRNALSTPLMSQLLDLLGDALTDPDVRAVVLSHTGPVFCSGADLKETAEARETGKVPAELLADVLAALWEFPKPVVARIAGPARAGGLGLIAAADIAVCTREATFAFTEVRLGVIPAVISATVLPRLTPRAAAELYLTGELFDGVRAAEVGPGDGGGLGRGLGRRGGRLLRRPGPRGPARTGRHKTTPPPYAGSIDPSRPGRLGGALRGLFPLPRGPRGRGSLPRKAPTLLDPHRDPQPLARAVVVREGAPQFGVGLRDQVASVAISQRLHPSPRLASPR